MRLFRRAELHAASIPRNRRLLCAALLLVICVLRGAASLHGQGLGDSAVMGVVDDANRHPVAAATILLKRLSPAAPDQAIEVRADGTFFKPQVAPGSYAVTVQAVGYVAEAVVEVPPGESLEMHITL